jgi:hypothetical protein
VPAYGRIETSGANLTTLAQPKPTPQDEQVVFARCALVAGFVVAGLAPGRHSGASAARPLAHSHLRSATAEAGQPLNVQRAKYRADASLDLAHETLNLCRVAARLFPIGHQLPPEPLPYQLPSAAHTLTPMPQVEKLDLAPESAVGGPRSGAAYYKYPAGWPRRFGDPPTDAVMVAGNLHNRR